MLCDTATPLLRGRSLQPLELGAGARGMGPTNQGLPFPCLQCDWFSDGRVTPIVSNNETLRIFFFELLKNVALSFY